MIRKGILLVFVIKYSYKCDLKEKWFILHRVHRHSLSWQRSLAGSSLRQLLRWHPHCGSRNMKAGAQLPFSFLFTPSLKLRELCHELLEQVFPTSCDLFKIVPPKHGQRLTF